MPIDKSLFQEWQKRYTIISLINTYSGVASFHLSFTEDSIARQNISTCIHSDNGKAFLSKHIKSNARTFKYQ